MLNACVLREKLCRILLINLAFLCISAMEPAILKKQTNKQKTKQKKNNKMSPRDIRSPTPMRNVVKCECVQHVFEVSQN